jgi:UDP-N-acetylmuramoylalanine--D-glutamate ligase
LAFGSLLWDENCFFLEAPGLRLRYPIPESKGVDFLPLENRLLAALAAFVFLGNPDVFLMLEGLKPLSYRISFEGSFNGVDVFNDSKATNVSSVELALRLIPPPILWIGGGLSKGSSFAPLRPYVKANVRQALFFGKASGILAKEFDGIVPYECFTTLEDLILSLPDVVKPGDRVLFSPGCASFDAFRSFRHRGFRFSELIAPLGLR